MARFLSECKNFDMMPEGYWRDSEFILYDIENEMSKQHIRNVISRLRFLQRQEVYCDKRKGKEIGEKVFYGEVFDLIEIKIKELDAVL